VKDQPVHLVGLHRLTQHGQQMPLPLLAQQAIRHVVEMAPLASLRIPAATRRDHVQRRVVPPIAARRLDDHDRAAVERAATDPAEDVIQTPHPTAHARTQHRWRLLIKRFPEERRHGQDDMTVDDALVEHPAHLADPGVDIDFGAAQAQR
jgi:hypothetical protein